MKSISIKSVQGFSSGGEKNLMVHSLRDSSATHILEGGIYGQFGYLPKLVVYLDSLGMEELSGIPVNMERR